MRKKETIHYKLHWNIPLYVRKYINFDEIEHNIMDIGPSTRSKIIIDKKQNKFKWFYWSRIQLKSKNDKVVSIKPSIYVVINNENKIRRLFIPKADFPDIVDSLTKFRKSIYIGVRFEKYMTAYKIYESLTDKRDIEFSAIRHALSHSKLNHKKTVEKLNEFFGDIEIDFNRYRHRKIFYIQLIKLYAQVDKLLYEKIKPLLNNTNKFLKNVEMVQTNPKTKQTIL